MTVQSTISPNVLLSAAQEIFETMVFMSIDPCEDPSPHIEGETLLGMITFDGDIEGCFGFCCDKSCAQAVAVDMLGIEPDEDLPVADINDAIGEIVNMLMGSIKAGDQALSRVKVSIPTVVRGREMEHDLGHQAEHMTSHIRIADQYTAELSLFWRRRLTENEAADPNKAEKPILSRSMWLKEE
jgi:chemotaxis protein CheX